MEKIALIMGESARNLVIGQRSLDRLAGIGEVVLGTGSDRDSVKKAISGATIAVTTWGNTPLDADILSVCPDLKLVCHAAGSVKPIVCDDMCDRLCSYAFDGRVRDCTRFYHRSLQKLLCA